MCIHYIIRTFYTYMYVRGVIMNTDLFHSVVIIMRFFACHVPFMYVYALTCTFNNIIALLVSYMRAH